LSGGGEDYVPFAGQSVGLIHEIRPARDIVSQTVAEAEQILRSFMPPGRTLGKGSPAAVSGVA